MREHGVSVDCRRHKKRKQEEMQFIKGNKKHHGGYSSGGGLTSKGPIVDGKAPFVCTLEIASTSMCWLCILFACCMQLWPSVSLCCIIQENIRKALMATLVATLVCYVIGAACLRLTQSAEQLSKNTCQHGCMQKLIRKVA
jgi:hypothetical protein